MKKLIILVFVLLSATSQAQLLKKSYYDYRKTKLKEEYMTNASGQKNGIYKKYAENGVLAVEATFKNDMMTGPGKEYYLYYESQGPAKLKRTGMFKDADKHGLFVTYDYIYEDKSASKYEGYDYLGSDDSYNYSMCLKTGKQVKIMEEEYEYNKVIHQKSWYKNGKLASDIYTKNGTCVAYNEEGKLITQFSLKDGKKEGDYVLYGKKGNMLVKGKYINNNRVGKWKMCYEATGNFVDPTQYDEKYILLTRQVFHPATVTENTDELIGDSVSTGYYLTGEKLDECYLFKEVSNQSFNITSSPIIDGRDSLHATYRAYFKSGKLRVTGQLRGGSFLNYKMENDLPILDIYKLSSDLRGSWIFYNENGEIIEKKEYSTNLE